MKIAVIAGNGPSLRDTDINSIPKDVAFFATNHYYKMWDAFERKPDNIVITDSNRIREIGDNYKNRDVTLYAGHQNYINAPVAWIKKHLQRDFVPLKQLPKGFFRRHTLFNDFFIKDRFSPLVFDKFNFSKWPEAGFNFGSSVVISSIQLAFSLGYEKVILIGVDSNYGKEKYFFKEDESSFYINHGFIKNPRLHMEPYLVGIQIFFEEFGLGIVDCTPGGKLKFIDKGNLNGLFDQI
jgi:hypothetical protein